MVRFHPAAEAEHLDTIAFYESRQPGLGGSYLHEFEAALSRISESPTRYRIERKPAAFSNPVSSEDHLSGGFGFGPDSRRRAQAPPARLLGWPALTLRSSRRCSPSACIPSTRCARLGAAELDR